MTVKVQTVAERVARARVDYEGVTPRFGPLGEEIFLRSYTRVLPGGGRESWLDACCRVVTGNCGFVDPRFIEPDEPAKLLDLLFHMRAIPAGRHIKGTGVPGRAFVSNCFGGDTKVLTRGGWKPIRELAGREVELVTQHGKRVTAPIKSFGEQHLMRVRYADGQTAGRDKDVYEVLVTPDHEWITDRVGRQKTAELKVGSRLLNQRSAGWRGGRLCPQGIQHGIVYGDGTLSRAPSGREVGSGLSLFAESVELERFFNLHPISDASYINEVGSLIPGRLVTNLPAHFKRLPDISYDSGYLMGFLAGWIAADGNVHKNHGTVRLHCKDAAPLEWARDAAHICGIRTSKVRGGEEPNPFDPSKTRTMYYIYFYSGDGVERLLIRSDHIQKREDYQSSCPRSSGANHKYSKVISVEETDIVEEVFCAQVEGTHSFVIEGSVLTGNCWSAGWKPNVWSAHFAVGFMRLMEGGGVGSNYSDSYFKRFGRAIRKARVHIVCERGHKDHSKMASVPVWRGDFVPHPGATAEPEGYVSLLSSDYAPEWAGSITVGDSREGWVEALSRLLDYYFLPDGHPDLVPGDDLVFDVSRVRCAGSPLKSFGGSASGPFYFAWMLLAAQHLMDGCVDRDGGRVGWLLAMGIDHEIARCVVSGNARRSARMAQKHWRDPDILDFINLKAGGGHWSTNISVTTDATFWRSVGRKDGVAHDILRAVARGIMVNGEPGLCNETRCNQGEVFPFYVFNPCVTGDTLVTTTHGLFTIKSLAERCGEFEAWTGQGGHRALARAFKTGRKEVVSVVLEDGALPPLRCTPDHEVMTPGGKVPARDLAGKLVVVCANPGGGDVECHSVGVTGVYPAGTMDVYDVSVAHEDHTFIANDVVVSNCGEITLPEWGSCNLGNVNLAHYAGDDAAMREAFRLMTRFLIRATFADYPDPVAKEVVDRDRRIGVGFMGFQNWLNLQGLAFGDYPQEQRVRRRLFGAYELIRSTARTYCFELRIPECVKVICVAPTGNTSNMVGVSAGMHPIYAPYFRRRVRFNVNDPKQREQVERLAASGLHVEDSATEGERTKVVTFVCRDPVLDLLAPEDAHLAEGAHEVSLADFFRVQDALQEDYADNAISVTVNFDADRHSEEDVLAALREHGPRLKGLTMLPLRHSYLQAPYEVLSLEEFLSLSGGGGQSSSVAGELSCPNNVCEVPQPLAQFEENS